MNEEMELDGRMFVFPYDVSLLESKISELLIVCKFVGIGIRFMGPDQTSGNFFRFQMGLIRGDRCIAIIHFDGRWLNGDREIFDMYVKLIFDHEFDSAEARVINEGSPEDIISRLIEIL